MRKHYPRHLTVYQLFKFIALSQELGPCNRNWGGKTHTECSVSIGFDKKAITKEQTTKSDDVVIALNLATKCTLDFLMDVQMSKRRGAKLCLVSK